MRNITSVKKIKNRTITRFRLLREGWEPEDSLEFLEPVFKEIENLADDEDIDCDIELVHDEEDPYIRINGDDTESERAALKAADSIYGDSSVLDLYYDEDEEGVFAFVSFDGLLGAAMMD